MDNIRICCICERRLAICNSIAVWNKGRTKKRIYCLRCHGDELQGVIIWGKMIDNFNNIIKV